ncbi:MAG: amidohydrolase, partial [Candidatus Cloacimonetes bacterium]|nr:amidohydrolase [Candidatus Cloacimonadota bacterium]
DDQLCPEWRSLVLDFPDRFLIGSDTWINQRWVYYEDTMNSYRTWLGGLPNQVAQNIAWRNGAALFNLKETYDK